MDKKYEVDEKSVCCFNCVNFKRNDFWGDIPTGICRKTGSWAGAGDARYTHCSKDGNVFDWYENRHGYDIHGEKIEGCFLGSIAMLKWELFFIFSIAIVTISFFI